MGEIPPYMNPGGDHPNPQGELIGNAPQRTGLNRDDTDCPCGENSWDGTMVACDSCPMWQHAVCFLELAPKFDGFHTCLRCAKDNPGLSCRDPTLLDMEPEDAQMTCRIRRVLDHLRGKDTVNQRDLMSYLTVNMATAAKIMAFLVREKILCIKHPRTSGKLTVSQIVLLDQAYPKWLKHRQVPFGFEHVP